MPYSLALALLLRSWRAACVLDRYNVKRATIMFPPA